MRNIHIFYATFSPTFFLLPPKSKLIFFFFGFSWGENRARYSHIFFPVETELKRFFNALCVVTIIWYYILFFLCVCGCVWAFAWSSVTDFPFFYPRFPLTRFPSINRLILSLCHNLSFIQSLAHTKPLDHTTIMLNWMTYAEHELFAGDVIEAIDEFRMYMECVYITCILLCSHGKHISLLVTNESLVFHSPVW